MSIPLIDLAGQHRALRRELVASVAGVIDSLAFINGPQVHELETRVARYTGTKHAIALNSGSDALFLALEALGIGPGDEVITTPFTFFATAGSISRLGARPVFADVDPRTFNIDPDRIAEKITRRTKAILPVHLFGLCADMAGINRIARRRGIPVIEDAAQAFGGGIGRKKAGALALAGCFSFYPTKNLGGAGDGGLVTTSSDRIASRIRLIRDHGSKRKYHHDIIGMNSRLDTLQAAMLLVKLKHIDRWNDLRIRHARDYGRAFRDLPVETPVAPAGYRHIYHLYSILTDRRDALAKALTAEGIGNAVYYPVPMHLQRCYRGLGYRRGDLPVSESLCKRILSLPVYPELDARSKSKIIRAVRRFFGKK